MLGRGHNSHRSDRWESEVCFGYCFNRSHVLRLVLVQIVQQSIWVTHRTVYRMDLGSGQLPSGEACSLLELFVGDDLEIVVDHPIGFLAVLQGERLFDISGHTVADSDDDLFVAGAMRLDLDGGGHFISPLELVHEFIDDETECSIVTTAITCNAGVKTHPSRLDPNKTVPGG